MKLQKPAHLARHLEPIWEEMVDNVMPQIGAAGLEALCGQIHRLRTAEAKITAEGIIIGDVKGNPIPHPALAVEKQAQQQIRIWLDKFGRSV